jgi:hypothetical protein
MHKLLTKILEFRFSDFLPHNKYLAQDFDVIDQAFRLHSDTISTERQLIKELPSIFKEITDQIHISVNLYEAVKNKNSDWIKQFEGFKYSKLIKDHADKIFKNGILLNELFAMSQPCLSYSTPATS